MSYITQIILGKSRAILSSAIFIVAFGTLLSRITGLFRIRLLSTTLGAGQELDAYYTAFRVPDLFSSLLVAGTLSVAFVPVFSKYLNIDRTLGLQFARRTLAATAFFVVFIMLILIAFAAPLVSLSAPGFSGQQLAWTIDLMRFIAIGQIFLAVSVLASAILQTFKSFLWPALSATFYNLGIIAGVVWLYPSLGMKGLGVGVVIGCSLHLLAQIPKLIKILPPKLKMVNTSKAMKELCRLYLPRLIYLDIGQASLLVATWLGSGMISGTVSTYTMSYDLALAPLGIFASSVATAVYPVLSDLNARDERKDFFESLIAASGKILQWMIPSSFGLYVFGLPIVEILFQGGEFDANASRMTVDALKSLCIGLPALGLLPLLTRAFWAKTVGKWPLMIVWSAILVYILFAVIFAKNGTNLALSLSVGAWIATVFLFAKIYHLSSHSLNYADKTNATKKLKRAILISLYQSVPAALIAILILRIGNWPEIYSIEWWVRVIFAGTGSLAVYFVIHKRVKNIHKSD